MLGKGCGESDKSNNGSEVVFLLLLVALERSLSRVLNLEGEWEWRIKVNVYIYFQNQAVGCWCHPSWVTRLCVDALAVLWIIKIPK